MASKAERLVADVKQRIDKGALAYGVQLPSANEFAKSYGITYPTAHKAIRKLADLGYVYRKQGRGTYVARHVQPRTRNVGLVIRTAGHVHGDVAHEVLHSLHDSGYTSQVIPLRSNGGDRLPSVRAAIEGLLSANPYAIIADDGAGHAHKALFEKVLNSGVPVIWKFCHEPPVGLGGHLVGYDQFSAFHQILSHLVNLGHHRLGAFAVKGFFDSGHALLRAMETVRGECPQMQLTTVPSELADSEQAQEAVRELLRRADRPTAFVCSMDFRAKVIIDIAKELSLRVPEDLSVTGFFNTPWSQAYQVTTVDVHPERIADGIVRILDQLSHETLTHESHRSLFRPELIVRSSVGPAPAASCPVGG